MAQHPYAPLVIGSMTYMYYMYIGFSNKWQTNQEWNFLVQKYFSPEHSIMSVKHLTFQFVLLELPTHLIYTPLPSTHQPRPMGEYNLLSSRWPVIAFATFVKSKRNRNVISILL